MSSQVNSISATNQQYINPTSNPAPTQTNTPPFKRSSSDEFRGYVIERTGNHTNERCENEDHRNFPEDHREFHISRDRDHWRDRSVDGDGGHHDGKRVRVDDYQRQQSFYDQDRINRWRSFLPMNTTCAVSGKSIKIHQNNTLNLGNQKSSNSNHASVLKAEAVIDYTKYFVSTKKNDIQPQKSDKELTLELVELFKTEMDLRSKTDKLPKNEIIKNNSIHQNKSKSNNTNLIVAAPDMDIEVGYQTILFKCPLSLSRMKYPSKGINCTHLQCFDLESFFALYPKPPAKCGWCNTTILTSQIQIDPQTLFLLAKYPDANGCLIDNKGDDFLLLQSDTDENDDDDDGAESDTPNFTYPEMEVIDLDSFVIDPRVFENVAHAEVVMDLVSEDGEVVEEVVVDESDEEVVWSRRVRAAVSYYDGGESESCGGDSDHSEYNEW